MPAARPDQPRRSDRPRRAATLGTALAACAVLAASAGAATVAGGAGAQAPAPAPAVPDSTTFGYTGKSETWTVPTGVTSVHAHVCGGTGSVEFSPPFSFALGGLGGCVDADVAVTSREVLTINVGGTGETASPPQGAYGGGGLGEGDKCVGIIGGNGGGASDIRIGNATDPNSRVLVGGGGGGGGADHDNGGPGGGGGGSGASGPDGTPGQPGLSGPGKSTNGGQGGTQTAAGAGGRAPGISYVDGGPGKGADGGNGGGTEWCGGGGGGGWFGGGAGASDDQKQYGAAGGGGGASYAADTKQGVTNPTFSAGPRPGGLGGTVTGDGTVILTPIPPTTTPTTTAAPSTVAPPTIAAATTPTTTAAPTTTAPATATPPNPPTITSAVPTIGGTPQVNVTFTLTSTPQATGVVFSTNGGTTWTAPTQPVSGSSGTFTFTTGSNGKPLPPGGTVSIVMAATGPGGQSQPTPATNVSIPAAAASTTTASTAPTTIAPSPTGGGTGTKAVATLCPATPSHIFATVGSSVSVNPYAGSPPPGAMFATASTPAGITVNPNGTIAGTPTAATTGAQQVTATVTSPATATGPAITQSCPLADIQVTAQAPAKLTVTPGVPAVLTPPTAPPPGAAYALAKGAPASMTIDPGTGTVAWTPTAGDKGAVTVTINQSGSGTTSSTSTKVVFRVAAPNSAATTVNAPASTTTTIPASVATEAPGPNAYDDRDGGACLAPVADIYPDVSWTAGSTLTVAPDVIGLAAPTSFTVTGGSLPEGLTLDNQVGVISGTPLSTNGGDGPLAITVTFADGSERRAVFNVGVTGTGSHVLDYPNRIIGSVGESVDITPAEHGGDGPARHTVVCGDLPAGMELDEATGGITGTPVAPDEFPEPIRIRSTRARTSTSGIAAPAGDTGGGYTESSFILVVAPEPVEWLRYPSTAVLGTGEAADITPTVSGIAKGERFKIVSGTLPKGLSFDTATGRITGTLEQAITRPLGLSIALDHANGTTAASADLILAGAPAADSTGSRDWLWVALIALLVLAVGVIAFMALRRRHDGPGSPHDGGLTIDTGPAGTPDPPTPPPYPSPPETHTPTAT